MLVEAKREVTMQVRGYESDLAFVCGALELLRDKARLRVIDRERAGLVPRDPIAMVSEEPIDREALEATVAEAAETHTARTAATEPAPALLTLQETFELSDFERDVVLLALAPAVDGSFNQLYGRLKGSSYRAPLDVEVALTLLVDDLADRIAHRSAFGPSGRLLQHNLLLVGRGSSVDGGDDFLALELRLPPRLVTLLLGREGEDATLQSFSRLIEPTETLDRVVLPPEDKRRIVELVALHDHYLEALEAWGLNDAIPYGRGVTMLFAGAPGTGKTLTARAVAHQLGRRLLLVDTAKLGQHASFETNLDNLLREARLQNAVLFFDECEGLFGAQNRLSGHLSALLQALEQFDGICILATNTPKVLDHALDRRILYRVNFIVPTPSMREAIWRAHLPEKLPLADDVDPAYLARRFEFTGGYIKNAVLLAAGAAAARSVRSPGAAQVTQQDLITACYSQLRHRLQELADRDVVELRLEDVILPDDVKSQVVEIIEAVSAQSMVFREWGFAKKFNKGRGLSALFDGEPGTGKTLSAEVIAAELGLSLYRVNVANVVSKFIGETEKNLTRIFAEARGSHSILLFDEADSLFSKRVEVKGSNDRFANMEVNVLLQLIERYDGLVILTTNLKSSIDSAFERRLSFKVNFPFPEADLRASIWEHMLPDGAPVADGIDYDLLGRCFELSGGSIKNAVLRSAYRAAATRQPLTMELFEDAAKRECQAAGKLFRVARYDDW